jgi:hypothetical protein
VWPCGGNNEKPNPTFLMVLKMGPRGQRTGMSISSCSREVGRYISELLQQYLARPGYETGLCM